MQKEEPKGYNLVNRAIYYACRLISSEKQREFVKMNFNDIVKVYSIWIVANMEDNSVNRIHFTQDTLYGSYKWNCDTDLINIIIIGITGQPDVIENKVSKENLKSLELCKMLNTLFSNDFKNKERYDRLEKKFNICVDDNEYCILFGRLRK